MNSTNHSPKDYIGHPGGNKRADSRTSDQKSTLASRNISSVKRPARIGERANSIYQKPSLIGSERNRSPAPAAGRNGNRVGSV